MGILDEAIREHLELKRRRGADQTEISRQENEAFGASRRTAEGTPAPDAEAPALDEPAAAYDAGPEAYDEPATSFAETVPAPAPSHLQLAHEPHPDPEPETHLQHEPDKVHGDPADALPPAAEPEPDHLAQPTQAFDPDEVRAAAGAPPEPEIVPADDEPAAEDVLEETPEFLQETPEHDRLWFEQRPPRDFDF
jgi:hypothetical protein